MLGLMARKLTKGGKPDRRGRPPSANPMGLQLNFRISAEMRAMLEAYRDLHQPPDEMGVKWDLSDAARHALRFAFTQAGLLKAKT